MSHSHRSTKKQRRYNRNSTGRRFACTVSLSWLSSISLISGGFVFAQSESPVDNIVSTVEVSQPTTLGDKGQNGHKSVPVESKSESSPTSVILKVPVPPVPNSQPEVLPNSTRSPQKTSTPATGQINNSNSQITGKDYNSVQIDPTEYDGNSSGEYDAPSSVEVRVRSQDCKAVISQAKKSVGTCTQENPTKPSVVNSTQKSPPTWWKKSAPASLGTNLLKTVPKTIPSQNAVDTNNRTQSQKSGGIVNSRKRISTKREVYAGMSLKKISYNQPRIPDPREFSSGKMVTPSTPSFGTLPPPMIEGKVPPRPSKVAYDFDLTSVLPEVPYIVSFTDNSTTSSSISGLTFPLSFAAPITSVFGWRIHPITGHRRFHTGMDIAAPTGTPILAAEKGQVEMADWIGGYGLAVTINHSQGQQTLYGHMSEIVVRPGQWVEPGMIIGRVGSTGNSTGPHLHFEVRHLTGNGWVAVDPSMQLQAGMNSLSSRVAYNYNSQRKQLR